MVPIRPTSSRGTNGHSTSRITIYTAVSAALALTGIYLLSLPSKDSSRSSGMSDFASSSGAEVSPRTAMMNQGLAAMSGSGSSGKGSAKNKEELDEEDVDPLKITHGDVTYGENKELPFYHCGPFPTQDNPDLTELVLLHGAAFTKEDWKTSGILDMLCEINNEEDEGNLSITALDLPVSADGQQLGSAFDTLRNDKVLSGRPATFVSPSASGKALVSLGEMAANEQSDELTRIVKAWIPVASGSVLSASDKILQKYKEAKIPILAIHGDQDSMGKKVTEKLKETNDAKGIELEGRHPVYLDSPEEFVQELMQFLDEMEL